MLPTGNHELELDMTSWTVFGIVIFAAVIAIVALVVGIGRARKAIEAMKIDPERL